MNTAHSSVIALKSLHIHAAGGNESLYGKVNHVKLLVFFFCFVFLIQRQSLCKIHFNPEVLSSPHSQALLFYVWGFGSIHALPHRHGFTGFMKDLWWKYSYLSYFPWHLFCITSRDHTVGLGPEGPDDSGLLRPGHAHCWAHMASNRLSDSGHVLNSRSRWLGVSVGTPCSW